jgi:hypothetical protein
LFLLLALVALFAAIYFPVMKREAARLEAAFPGDYSLYASRVPLLLPRIPRTEGLRRAAFSWNQVWVNREPVTVLGLVLVVAILWGKWKFAGP